MIELISLMDDGDIIKKGQVYYTDAMRLELNVYDSKPTDELLFNINWIEDNYLGSYYRYCFMTIAEWREKQIKSVLDD